MIENLGETKMFSNQFLLGPPFISKLWQLLGAVGWAGGAPWMRARRTG